MTSKRSSSALPSKLLNRFHICAHPFAAAEKALLRLIQLADLFLMPDCVQQCASSLEQLQLDAVSHQLCNLCCHGLAKLL